MNKSIYFGLVITAGLIVLSETSLAETSSTIFPVTIAAPVSAVSEHKKTSTFHKAMVAHYKALIAADYGKTIERKNHE